MLSPSAMVQFAMTLSVPAVVAALRNSLSMIKHPLARIVAGARMATDDDHELVATGENAIPALHQSGFG